MTTHLAAGAVGLVAGAAIAATITLPTPPPTSPVDGVIATIEREEGFRATPYNDTRGVLTIGYGTNLQQGITQAEAAYLARERLQRTWDQFVADEPWTADQPIETQEALLDMAYQLGVGGLERFSATLAALEAGDCPTAQAHAHDSLWASQTPTRADDVIARLC